jgi:hypothetical protein
MEIFMDKEIQKNMLLVQLKILKELRQLNKTLTEGVYHPTMSIRKKEVFLQDLNDVCDVMANIGYNYI